MAVQQGLPFQNSPGSAQNTTSQLPPRLQHKCQVYWRIVITLTLSLSSCPVSYAISQGLHQPPLPKSRPSAKRNNIPLNSDVHQPGTATNSDSVPSFKHPPYATDPEEKLFLQVVVFNQLPVVARKLTPKASGDVVGNIRQPPNSAPFSFSLYQVNFFLL